MGNNIVLYLLKFKVTHRPTLISNLKHAEPWATTTINLLPPPPLPTVTDSS